MLEKIKYYIKKYGFAFLLAIISMITLNAIFGQVCLSKIFFGIPCPACGMTRAFFYLMEGRFIDSFRMNPMLLPAIGMFIAYLIMKKILKKSFLFINTYAIICLLTIIFVYVYRMCTYFPNQEPYTYYKYNLLRILMLTVHTIQH